MPIPEAQKLLQRAQAGEKLTPKERRHCIAFLMATAPETNQTDMADWFGVSERQIRFDKRHIREERAALIKEEDIALVIADIAFSFDNQVRDIETSKRKCDKGTRTYLEHCKAVFDMQLRRVKALQDLGYYPKNLGNMVIDRYVYAAEVGKDGSVNTRPVDLQFAEDGTVIEADYEEVAQNLLEAVPDEECEDTAQLVQEDSVSDE